MVEIKQMFAPIGSKCRPGITLKPTYITIHNTANTNCGAGAENHAKYLQGCGAKETVSWHYAVDDKLAVNCIPECEVAWHAADRRKPDGGNMNSLAIEICENPESDLKTATDNAAELTALLMVKYNIPIERVVQHHHWKSSAHPLGKNCPRRIRAGEPYDWATFLAVVQSFLCDDQKPVVKPISVKYQAYTKDHWAPFVVNDGDFAGNLGKPISALRAGLTEGHIKYRVHAIGKVNYYGWVTDYNTTNSNGYAGVPGKPIDKLQMTLVGLPGYVVEYQVHTVNGKWWGWVRDYNNRNSDGYAGVKNRQIDGIRIRIVKL